MLGYAPGVCQAKNWLSVKYEDFRSCVMTRPVAQSHEGLLRSAKSNVPKGLTQNRTIGPAHDAA